MQLIRNRPGKISGPPTPAGRSAVAIGNFDGVHRGHQALIEACRIQVGAAGRVAVVTFEPLPQAFFQPGQGPARLSTVYRKLDLLRAYGVDLVWLMRFDRALASLTAHAFADQVLRLGLDAGRVVVGEDFRFGRGREGDVQALRKYGREMRFEVETVPPVRCGDERISSSGIRDLLAAGDFEKAAAWLGRPFCMEGRVVRGAKLGRKLGYPTANLKIRARPSPLQGVFAVFARQAGERWLPAVTNLGCRPAVGGEEPLLEVHFFDFEADLYGQRLEVQFVEKLRDELNFETIADLVEQMKRDEAAARALLACSEPPQQVKP